MLQAMSAARSVTFSAYVLWPGRVEQALKDAVRRGAHVTVRLNGYFYKGSEEMLRDNRNAFRLLRGLGADVQIVHRSDTDGACLHAKAAVCDGVAFLDDRNWLDSGDTVLRDDGPAAVRAIRNAASYRSGHCRGVQLDKGSALKSESGLLRTSQRDRVDVAAEAIGFWNVYGALKNLADAGAKPRLLISKDGLHKKYLHAARLLEKAGVRVRVAATREKFAVVDGTRAWLGSANPTSAYRDANQVEWGVRTRDSSIVKALESHFNAQWRAAAPLPAASDKERVPS